MLKNMKRSLIRLYDTINDGDMGYWFSERPDVNAQVNSFTSCKALLQEVKENEEYMTEYLADFDESEKLMKKYSAWIDRWTRKVEA